MAILRVVADYEAGPVRYRAGETITVTEEFAEFLLRDSPGSFEEPGAAVEAASADDAAAPGITAAPPRGRRR
ncbi:hypothetical protein [Tepidiforma sp.]|uniref:hypothetical protein n=1 Tax=Tepidiforma sp. TaxID=2682230 RepID=UPI0026251FF4|nr:hypothetical protein [Tepidiforma sp.]MCX7618925.1 hypothetical protein [Tepidiforma sp.]